MGADVAAGVGVGTGVSIGQVVGVGDGVLPFLFATYARWHSRTTGT